MAREAFGNLDFCSQAYCAGWAVWQGAPARLGIWQNDRQIGEAVCADARPDLPASFPRDAGFTFYFPETLTLADRIDVRFPDGTDLPGSTGTAHHKRLARMLTGVDPARPGLEFGPLSRPLLSRRRSAVRYVDYLTRADLLALKRSPQDARRIRPELIPEIDFVWKGRDLLGLVGEGWEYCLASHMIEHAPDPIGFLGQFAEVLVPGGRVNLAIPDREQTFDHARALSRPADMLDAWSRGLTQPCFSQIFDHVMLARPPGTPPGDMAHHARVAFDTAVKAGREGQYVDVHCHVWTFESFLACWQVIEGLGIVPLRLADAYPSEPHAGEFIVSLVRT
jgi:SAM-dependent methyltransferase